MTKCRFRENRYLPIEYSLENLQSKEGYFSLCLIKKGNAVLSIDGTKCYLSAPALPESRQKSGNHKIGKASNENDLFRP